MTQQEKQILLKDLCARLPYGIIASVSGSDEEFQHFHILGIKYDKVLVKNDMLLVENFEDVEVVKPYLRPMSSMTEEERKEYNNECNKVLLLRYSAKNHYPVTDWLLAHHFDFRGLIEKGLALEASEGMYK